MIVYLGMIGLSLGISYYLRNVKFVVRNIEITWIHIFLISFPFVIVSGLRASDIGMDYQSYTISYYQYGNLASGREWEILGSLIIQIANMLKSPIFIIWFYTIVNCVGTIWWIKRQSINCIYSVLLFFISGFFNWSLNIMRQTTASIIVFVALELLLKKEVQKKDKLLFLLAILLATMFHKTAAIYLILLIFPYGLFVKNIWRFVYLLLFLPITSSLIREVILILSQKLNFYYRYFNNYYDQGTYTGSLIFISIVGLVIVVLTYKKWIGLEGNKYVLYASMQYIGLCFALIANIVPNNARITYLFFPITIVALPEFVRLINWKYRKIVVGIVFVCFITFFMNSYVFGNWGETVPYKWIFQ